MSARERRLIYQTRCKLCSVTMPEGTVAMYDRTAPKGARAWHVDCAVQPQPQAPEAEPTEPRTTPSDPVTVPEPIKLPGIKGDVWHVAHDSVEAFCTYPVHALNRDLAAREWDSDSRNSWAFGEAGDRRTFIKRVRQGWPDGAARLAQIATAELTRPLSVRRARHWTDHGDHVEMSRVWAGRVDVAWSRCTRQSRTAPRIVRLVPFIGGACSQHESKFFYRGAAVARLSDALTSAGYNVEIIGACVGESLPRERDSTHYAHALTLKPATAPLDLSNLAAVMCQVGFFRYYTFRSMAGAPLRIGSHFCYYGDPAFLNELARATVPQEPNVATFYMEYGVDDKDKAEQWIADVVKTLDGGEQRAAA